MAIGWRPGAAEARTAPSFGSWSPPIELSHETELLIVGLLAAGSLLLILSRLIKVPYPIILVIGGAGVGFIPGVPSVELDPRLVLVAALPPLLYAAAFFSSVRDLRRNWRPIMLLSLGLTILTMVAVAVAAHALIDGMTWEAAFVLGAVVSPTDPVAANATADRLGLPQRVVTVLEGESLVNDATALVAYKFALTAAITGGFSLAEAGLQFVLGIAGGIVLGIALAAVASRVRSRLRDAQTEIAISFVTPYFAYLPAEMIGASGVIATVTTGLILGFRAPRMIGAETRLQSSAAWGVVVFVLNSLLFLLIGLQLPDVVNGLSEPTATLIFDAAVVVVTVIAIRVIWIFPMTLLPRAAFRWLRERSPAPPWRIPAIISWAGMRGAVSLAAALAIPFSADSGDPLASRDLIIFLTYAVIMATLVGQGLTLPRLVRMLRVSDSGEDAAHEDARARLQAAEAALERLEDLDDEEWVRDDTAERMRDLYDYRRRRFAARAGADEDPSEDYEDRSLAFQRLRRELLEAERTAILGLRNRGEISDDIRREIERDLDLEESRLGS